MRIATLYQFNDFSFIKLIFNHSVRKSFTSFDGNQNTSEMIKIKSLLTKFFFFYYVITLFQNKAVFVFFFFFLYIRIPTNIKLLRNVYVSRPHETIIKSFDAQKMQIPLNTRNTRKSIGQK